MGWKLGLGISVAGGLGVVACFNDAVPVDMSTTSGMETSASSQPGGSESSSSSSSSTEPSTLDGGTTGDGTTDFGSESTSLSGSESSSSSGDSSGSTQSIDPTDVTSGSSSDSITETTGVDPTATSTTSGSSGFEETSGFVGFILDPDLGPGSDCSVWEQDCSDDEKCSAWASDGGSVWNAWRCVPLDPSAGAIGDPCTVEGNLVSGVDSCELGAICFDVDPETNTGICSGFCVGSEDNPVCDDPEDACVDITGDGWLPLCLPTCEPFLQDCADGQGCYGDAWTFVCAPDVSGDDGMVGDPCAAMNACDAGNSCAAAELVPGCAAASCCASLCDIEALDCGIGLECVPYFEIGMAPPGWEDVGVCGDPP